MPKGESIEQRILANMELQDDGCLLWSGAKNGNGYGSIWFDVKYHSVHRVAYMIMNGDLSSDDVVCHICDTPLCINPDHLYAGTTKTNAMDRSFRLRGGIGERNGSAKLNEGSIKEIIASSATSTHLAKKYGVCKSTICRIKRGLTWKHLS